MIRFLVIACLTASATRHGEIRLQEHTRTLSAGFDSGHVTEVSQLYDDSYDRHGPVHVRKEAGRVADGMVVLSAVMVIVLAVVMIVLGVLNWKQVGHSDSSPLLGDANVASADAENIANDSRPLVCMVAVIILLQGLSVWTSGDQCYVDEESKKWESRLFCRHVAFFLLPLCAPFWMRQMHADRPKSQSGDRLSVWTLCYSCLVVLSSFEAVARFTSECCAEEICRRSFTVIAETMTWGLILTFGALQAGLVVLKLASLKLDRTAKLCRWYFLLDALIFVAIFPELVLYELSERHEWLFKQLWHDWALNFLFPSMIVAFVVVGAFAYILAMRELWNFGQSTSMAVGDQARSAEMASRRVVFMTVASICSTFAYVVAIVVDWRMANDWSLFIKSIFLALNAGITAQWLSSWPSNCFQEKLGLAVIDDEDVEYKRDGAVAEKLACEPPYINVAQRITDKINHTHDEKPWIIALGGGPGSGKGTVLKWLIKKLIVADRPVVGFIDCDRIRTKLQTWTDAVEEAKTKHSQEEKAQIMEKARGDTQVLAGKIAEKTVELCMQQRKSFVFDSTLRKELWARQMFSKWRKAGFRVLFIFVDTELPIAQERVLKREKATGRPVQPEFVISCHADSRKVANIAEKTAEDMTDLFVRIKNDIEEPVIGPSDVEKIKKFMGADMDVSCIERATARFWNYLT